MSADETGVEWLDGPEIETPELEATQERRDGEQHLMIQDPLRYTNWMCMDAEHCVEVQR